MGELTAKAGPFFIGTLTVFQPDDVLTVEQANAHGRRFATSSRDHLSMSDQARMASGYARPAFYDDRSIGRVYEVFPLADDIEPDPDEQHHPEMAYRTAGPLRVVREVGPGERGPSRITPALWRAMRENEQRKPWEN
jgi:hypothetical protein